MDKYRRIPNKSDADELGPDEVRITARGRVTKYVEYALKLLKEGTEQSNGPLDTIVIKAAGRAINKAVLTVEIVKRRVKGLHQENELKTLEMNDRWEPLEQGLHEVITTRRLPYIIVTLTTAVGRVNTDSPGYQEPLPEEIVDADTQAKQEANTRRSERRRSGQQDFNTRDDRGDRRGPGGRGRGGRGQGRRRGGGGGGQGGGGGNQQAGRRRRRQGGGSQQGGGGQYDRGQSQQQQQGGRRRGGRRYDDDVEYEDDGRGQYNQGFQGRQRRDRQDGRRRRGGRGGYRGGGGQGGNYQGGRRGGNGGGGSGGNFGGYNEDYMDGQGYGGGGGQRQRGGYNRRQRGPRGQFGGGGGGPAQYGYAGQY